MSKIKKSKRYQALVKDFDKLKALKIEDAVKVIKEKAKAKFVESFDVRFAPKAKTAWRRLPAGVKRLITLL